ncbi:MAG: eCIS core domain-containing protein, partial [Nostoc sp.]
MSDRTFGRNKAGTSNFSNPSLVSPTTPTLANPVRSFGLPTNNVIQTATEESTNLQEAQSADEQSLLSEAIPQRSFGHDISRIALRRPQAKLTVGEPGDKYEQEADWVANQVMRMVVPDKLNAQSLEPVEDSLQRKCTACEQEEDKIQTKPSIQTANDGGLQAGDNIESRLNSSKGGGSTLSDEVRSFMEPRFDADFSFVRVHTDSEAVQMNRELGAQAFTHGSDVYYGAG